MSWHGTLVEGKRDGSGFAYMRNRVYDGRTGRFTQEDPIGLAGGLNGYGFAEGDPVNFSDPFGLNPCLATPRLCFAIASAIQQAVGAASDFVRNYRAMREANTIGADKYFHCMANCEATKRGPFGQTVAEVISDLREVTDQIKGDPPEASKEDQAANARGRQGATATPPQPCTTVCSPLRPRTLQEKP